MRLLITLLFSTSLTIAFGQNNDSLSLTIQAKEYLLSTHVEKDINKSSQQWDTTKLIETLNHNKNLSKGKIYTEKDIAQIKSTYLSYLNKIHVNFYLKNEITLSEMQIEGNQRQMFITYYYQLEKNIKSYNEGVLIFRSKDQGNSWKIADIGILSAFL